MEVQNDNQRLPAQAAFDDLPALFQESLEALPAGYHLRGADRGH